MVNPSSSAINMMTRDMPSRSPGSGDMFFCPPRWSGQRVSCIAASAASAAAPLLQYKVA